jgi:transcriptional regulator with GAF, ATPase, and Fis domain
MIPDSRSKLAAAGSPFADSQALVARILRRWLEIVTNRPPRPAVWRRPADRWISLLVDEISKTLGGSRVQLLAQSGSKWEVLAQHAASSDRAISLQTESLIFAALDSPQPVHQGQSIVVAIHRGGDAIDGEWSLALSGSQSLNREQSENAANQFLPTVMLIEFIESNQPINAFTLDAVAVLASTLSTLDRQQHLIGIAGDSALHLRRLLDLSIQWAQIEQTDQLLEAIATSSAELLGAERASIFLWEKKRGKLVGRPALGVEGGKLEVDDNAGIVGSVLSTGHARIWNQREDSESEVNRAVDKKLKFETKSLVAVPLKSPSGATLGVFEVINKKQGTFDANDAARLIDLARHAAAAIQGTETRQRLTSVRDRLLQDAASTYQVIGESPAMRTLRDTVARVARTDLAVLALGENGTGKEVLARSIHFQSSRRDQPFIAVNCAALVESLLESELFGHERGAFTDAVQARPGKFELATGGTLFLDEIGDMSPGGQAKLLRVLEEKIVVRVGGSTPIPVDVRIIAATNQSLPELVAAKKFREDLFFRLNVVSFRLPPLRERGEDILTLATHFLTHFAAQVGRALPTFAPEAREALLRHRWPGNVRELRNVMERACYLSLNDTLTEADLGLTSWDTSSLLTPVTTAATSNSSGSSSTRDALPGTNVPLTDATRVFQVAHIQQAIDHCRGNMTSAAELLGLHRSNLYRKMKHLGMKIDEDESV